MKAWGLTGCVLALAWSGAVATAGDYLHPSATTAWAERVQIVYQPRSRSVVRRMVRAWDPNPERGLDFVWEPAAGQEQDGLAADGAIDGTGRIVWRVKGSASYDPRTIFSAYDGELKYGRPNGKGRLEIRTGEVIEGDWVDGAASGVVLWIDPDGNRYEGAFSNGKPNGRGVERRTNGEIFTGAFVDGLREGEGRTRLAGGTVYRSVWHRGVETGGARRPDMLADARIGGLLRAESNGGDAGKVEIGVSVEERMNQQAEMKYQHLVRDEDIAIYPASEDINAIWNGEAQINTGDYVYAGTDYEQSPAFVQVDLATKDGSRAKLKSLALKVANSETYRKPMLTLTAHEGCVGFRPTFSFVNHGWGAVRDAKLSIAFSKEEEGGPESRKFELPVADFDQGADVSVQSALEQAGVDTGKLEKNRYSCKSMDSLNVCRSQLFNDVGFGEIADYVWGDDKLYTTIQGKFDYSWADDSGALFTQSEPIRATIALATIEVPKEAAECGDGYGGSPEALRFQDVPLPLGKRDYVIDMPVRGNKTIAKYTARLKMHAEQSSFHQMSVSAQFADGSTRDSKPITLFYFRPRPTEYLSTLKPTAACYLPEVVGGCG